MSSEALKLDPGSFDRAFEAGEFVVLYQPKVSLVTGRARGCEAFIRWRHPEYGMLLPALFLEPLEKSGRMIELTRYVLDHALAACRAWRGGGYDWSVSVNLSTEDLLAPGLEGFVREALARHNLPGQALTLEIREHVAGNLWSEAEPQLRKLRAAGCGVALDGPGLVPVDLSGMSKPPFTEVKIGGSAIIRFAQIAARVGGIAGLVPKRLADAQRLGLERTAVGAEDETTLRALTRAGFNAVQGELLQRPVPAHELRDFGSGWLQHRDALPEPEPVLPLILTVAPLPVEEEETGETADGDPAAQDAPVAEAERPRLRRLARIEDGASETAEADEPVAAMLPSAEAGESFGREVPVAAGGAATADDEEEPLDIDFDDDDEYLEAEGDGMDEIVEPEDDSSQAVLDATAPLSASLIDRPAARADKAPDSGGRPAMKTSRAVAERFAPKARPGKERPSLLEELGLGHLLGGARK